MLDAALHVRLGAGDGDVRQALSAPRGALPDAGHTALQSLQARVLSVAAPGSRRRRASTSPSPSAKAPYTGTIATTSVESSPSPPPPPATARPTRRRRRRWSPPA